MTEQSIFVVRPLERPQTKAQIEGPILGSKNKYQPDVIINAVINVLSNTSLDLNFEKYCGFPKASTLITSHPMIGKKSQNKSNRPLANKSTSNIDQKLLIKVVKGYDLDFTDGDENENHQIYCTIEIDEPFNVCKSSVVRQNLQTPIWDQHFMQTQ
ncbi:hypothetical protein SSS_10594 [Sarcoptes scabiei]|nr:hypothetical protein SSS_10594 [Sarcoptes scabiei]